MHSLTSVQHSLKSLAYRLKFLTVCMGAKNQYSQPYNFKISNKIAACDHNLQIASNWFSHIATKQNDWYHYITLYFWHFWIALFSPQWKMLSVEVSLWEVWELICWFFDICKPRGALPACNYLTTKLLERLKTVFHVHHNRLLHTWHTAALCIRIAKVCYFQEELFVARTLLKAETQHEQVRVLGSH